MVTVMLLLRCHFYRPAVDRRNSFRRGEEIELEGQSWEGIAPCVSLLHYCVSVADGAGGREGPAAPWESNTPAYGSDVES
jgi:hypothetical protein